MKPRLQVMKFGGTSLGDAVCIARTAQIIAKGAREKACVAVVSAMSGVTNRLIDAANKAQSGNVQEAVDAIEGLRAQHDAVLLDLTQKDSERCQLRKKIDTVLAEGRRLCEGTALLRELTPRTLDAISSLGERLSAPLVSMSVRELGLPSEAIEATDLILTDPFHACPQPQLITTHEKSQARLLPLLDKGIVPIVTGFIGSTPGGPLTTLRRGELGYFPTNGRAGMRWELVTILTHR